MEYYSANAEATIEFARKLGAGAKKDEVYCLHGQFGAGKTTFAKGFAQGLGITDNITSPSFALINEYAGDIPFYHFDVYRLENSFSPECFSFEEYFDAGGICLVEWAEFIKDIIPESAVHINIVVISENERTIRVEQEGKKDDFSD